MSKEDRKARQAERKENRKDFKDTGLGVFLKDKLPAALDVVGDLLPDEGGLGVLKNIISKDDTLSEVDKAEGLRLANEELALYLADQQNARERQVEMAKAGVKEYLPAVIGYTVLAAFMSILLYGLIASTPNMEIYFHLMGVTEGTLLTIIAYYYGNSIHLKKDK